MAKRKTKKQTNRGGTGLAGWAGGRNPTKRPVNTKPRDRSFFFGFCLAALFLFICLFFLPARYETNDDFSFILQLSPRTGFEPGEMTPYLSHLLWMLLRFLYQVVPAVPWYGIIVYSAIFVGIGLIAGLCIRHCKGVSVLISLPGFLVLLFHCAVLTSYTAATLLLELAVFLSVMEWVIIKKCPAINPTRYGVLLLCGLLASYCVRWRLVLYGLAFAGPVLLFVSKQQLRRGWLCFVVFIALIAVDRGLFYLKSSSEVGQYLAYDALRRSFHDTVKGEFHKDRTPGALARAGWTLEDGITFKRWILYDDRMFNVEKLGVFLEANDPQKTFSLLKLIPKRIAENIRKRKYYTVVFVCTILALLLARARDIVAIPREDAIRIVLAVGAVFSVILFFAYYRFVPRVFVPLYMYGMALMVLLLNVKALPGPKRAGSARFKAAKIVCGAMLAIGAYGAAYAQAADSMRLLERSKKEKAYILRCLHEVKSRRAGAEPILVLINPSDSLGREYVHPLKEMADYSDLRFFPSGTDINSPRYYRILRSLNLTSGHEFLRWTIDNEKILFAFFAGGPKYQAVFTNMWESYYNRRISKEGEVKLRTVFDFRDQSGVGLIFFKATKYKS